MKSGGYGTLHLQLKKWGHGYPSYSRKLCLCIGQKPICEPTGSKRPYAGTTIKLQQRTYYGNGSVQTDLRIYDAFYSRCVTLLALFTCAAFNANEHVYLILNQWSTLGLAQVLIGRANDGNHGLWLYGLDTVSYRNCHRDNVTLSESKMYKFASSCFVYIWATPASCYECCLLVSR